MSLQIKSTSRRRVQFKLTLTATFRANSFHSDVMFRWIAKVPWGKENNSMWSLGKKKETETQNNTNTLPSVNWKKDSGSHRKVNELICSVQT